MATRRAWQPKGIMIMQAITTNLMTLDGLTVYDLCPQGGELLAVAGPSGFDPKLIDPDNLPDGFRWVESDEWADLQSDVDD